MRRVLGAVNAGIRYRTVRPMRVVSRTSRTASRPGAGSAAKRDLTTSGGGHGAEDEDAGRGRGAEMASQRAGVGTGDDDRQDSFGQAGLPLAFLVSTDGSAGYGRGCGFRERA